MSNQLQTNSDVPNELFIDFDRYNKYMIEFMELVSKPVIDMDVLYENFYSVWARVFDLKICTVYFLSYNVDYSQFKVKFFRSSTDLEDDKFVISLSQHTIKRESVVYLTSNEISSIAVKKTIPEQAMISMLVMDGQVSGAIVIYSYDKAYNPIFDSRSKAFVSFISNALALAKHKNAFEKRINFLAYNDYLTNLPNRTYFCELLVSAMQDADYNNSMLAILMVDIDKIKHVNDTLGYYVGDAVIQQTGRRLKQVVGECCPVSRFGGDDFTVLLPNLDDIDKVYTVCNDIIATMKLPICVEEYIISATVSIGVSIFPYNGESVDDMIKNADAAMNQSKNDGKSSYKFYSEEMTELTGKMLFLNNQLHQAIENDEFELYYQAQLDLNTNTISSVEALIRWMQPERGMMLPYDFIPFAEENGLIIPIDKLVIRKACMQAKKWYDEGRDIKVSINISPEHFKHGKLVECITSILEEVQLPASQIKVEILESALLEDLSHTIEIINELKNYGIGIALDDFGSGYSSLEYITNLPIDIIKIDRAFSMKLEQNQNNKIVVKTIITLAREMNFQVIAEGVEKQSHIDFLKEEGCDMAQGYFINRPLPVEEIEKLFDKYSN